jgi:hypothetical protein
VDAFDNTVPNLNFNLEEEVNNKINFLDVTITKNDSNLSFDINRKPSFRDTFIPNDSCHPREHKLSAIRYSVNRMTTYTYNLSPTSIQKEHDRLKQILHNNKYDTSILHKVNNKNNKREHDIQKTEWAKFTYMGKETRLITNLFKNTGIKIAFTTNNNIVIKFKRNMIDAEFTSLPAHHAIENILDKRLDGFVSDFKNTSETTNT